MADLSLDAPLTEGGPAAAGSPARVGDYLVLLKPRVMALVVFTGLAGLVAAPGSLHPFLALVAVAAIALASGAAGAINMWYDRDIDAVMVRTRRRPIPAGRIAPDDALAFGIVLTVLAVVLMGLAVNWLAALLLAAASAFYVFVYTIWLKRRTPQNIVIGGAAGAFPPVIGWAAATGEVSAAAVALFALIFFWTPPHFWALSLYASADYARAGVPMLPVVAGAVATRRAIFLYSLTLAPLAVLPWALGAAGALYLAVALGASAVFLVLALAVLAERDGVAAARRLFRFSILYLALVFLALMADRAGVPA